MSLVTNGVALEGEYFTKDLSESFSDPDGDKLLFQLDGLPVGSGLTITPATGVMKGTPTTNDVNLEGPWPLRVTAIDGKGGWVQGQFFLTVHPGTRRLLLCVSFYSGCFASSSISLSIWVLLSDNLNLGFVHRK